MLKFSNKVVVKCEVSVVSYKATMYVASCGKLIKIIKSWPHLLKLVHKAYYYRSYVHCCMLDNLLEILVALKNLFQLFW